MITNQAAPRFYYDAYSFAMLGHCAYRMCREKRHVWRALLKEQMAFLPGNAIKYHIPEDLVLSSLS